MTTVRHWSASSARAFTLSEMLIVLAIMGLLAGIAVWSVAGVLDAAESAAADAADSGDALQCDAARGGLLFISGCEGQTLPAALAEPQLGPIATTIMLDPVDGSTPIGGALSMTITVTDQADEPFEQAAIRYEITGVGALEGSTPQATSSNGTTTLAYGRSSTGIDTITICTNADGTLPDECATANGPSASTTHTWVLPRPLLVSWDRVNNSRAEIVWDRALGNTPSVVGYRFYNSAADCASDSSPSAASNRTVVNVAGNGETTVEVDAGVGLQPGQVGNRRLRILADTETNTEGLGNLETSCLAVGSVPEPATLTISPSAGASETGDTVEFTVTVQDGNGDGYSGVSVRYEITGIGDLWGAADSTTNASGQTTFSYSRSDEGNDEIVACTNADGSLPADCDSATGPNGSAQREWAAEAPPPLPAPVPISWSRVNNSTADVVWDRELGGTFSVSGYVFYANAANCENDNNPSPSSSRAVQAVAGNGETTIRVNSGGVGLQPGQLGNRRLRILLNTETNLEGLGNAATGCLAAS